MQEVRTRFAPSPTGYLHIGGVRTALFNWLFARRHGGSFVLRIDDTDRRRNVAQALRPILDGFRWLGIDWDEGPEVGGAYAPYYQSERQELYRSAAQTLVERGLAYHDYARTEELQEERETAQSKKRRFIYSRRFLAETAEERRRYEAEGRSGVVRLKMPRQGSCVFDDWIRGRVEIEWALEQDHVIQRADGSCLYHLASVVDDGEMRISHVIRAEEHLSNTPRQIFIGQGLGYDLPRFAHLPVVAEPGSRNKLSKRKLDKYLRNEDFARLNAHGREIAGAIGLVVEDEAFNPVVVDFYEQIGYLAPALVNYLLLLGWSLDDRTEFFGREQMIEVFSLDRVNRAAASFDPQKLNAFQERYMLAEPVERRVEMVLPFLHKAGLIDREDPAESLRATVTGIVEAAADRIKIAGDILDYDDFFVPDEALHYDEKAFDKRLRKPAEAGELLAAFNGQLADVEPWTATALEQAMQEFVETRGLKIGRIIHAVRVAVTGKAVGFGLFETLEILGRERSMRRIELALSRI